MAWNNWHDFVHMGGYAVYVWGSVGATLGALIVEVMSVRTRWVNVHKNK